MAIRERQLTSTSYSSGNTQVVDLPRDAVYHTMQLSCFNGTFSTAQGAMGTGPQLVAGFPFTLIRSMRLYRNGSDVIWQGSGEQLAKEHYYMNKEHPLARIYTVAGNSETLRIATVRGITVPANSEGIGANGGGFSVPDAPAGTGTVNFDFQAEIWFQMGPDDAYYGTLVDARKLASFQIEIQWATEAAQIAAAGTANTSNTAAFSMQFLSLDQDNLDVENDFGTFKRSSQYVANIPYASSNQQIMLPRGNFFQGVVIGTKAFKAGSSVNAAPENSVLGNIQNRINSNFYLRSFDFRQIQAKNQADAGGRSQAFATAQGTPQGYGFLSYINAAQKASEMVPTYVMDQFDFLVSTLDIAQARNGATTGGSNPIIELLIQEVIPGVSIGGSAPQGAQMGSTRATSAKPFAR